MVTRRGGAPLASAGRPTASPAADGADKRPRSSKQAAARRHSSGRSVATEPARPAAEGAFKLLALDLDGTLLDHRGEANDEDVSALRRLKARGITLTILTGRLYSGARPAAELLGIDGPVGCADGSHVVRVKDDKTLSHHGIRGRAANRLRASLERHDLVAFLFAENAIVHDERGADYLPYVRTWSTDLRYAYRVTEHALWDSRAGMTAVVALGREANISRAVADIERDETDAVQLAMFPYRRDTEQWAMVARAAGRTKATALEYVAAHYGIAMSETVCVGDWLNDVPMLSAAGRSFAMGQAPKEVKQAATDVLVRDITSGGAIAEAIAKAFPR